MNFVFLCWKVFDQYCIVVLECIWLKKNQILSKKRLKKLLLWTNLGGCCCRDFKTSPWRPFIEGRLIYKYAKAKAFQFWAVLWVSQKELAAALQITAHQVAEDIKEPWYLSIRKLHVTVFFDHPVLLHHHHNQIFNEFVHHHRHHFL